MEMNTKTNVWVTVNISFNPKISPVVNSKGYKMQAWYLPCLFHLWAVREPPCRNKTLLGQPPTSPKPQHSGPDPPHQKGGTDTMKEEMAGMWLRDGGASWSMGSAWVSPLCIYRWCYDYVRTPVVFTHDASFKRVGEKKRENCVHRGARALPGWKQKRLAPARYLCRDIEMDIWHNQLLQ